MKNQLLSGLDYGKRRVREFSAVVLAAALPLSVALSGGASAATPPSFGLQPFEFVGTAQDCGTAGQDTVTAKWDDTTGAPSPSIQLQKLGDTNNCAAAGVDIISSLEGKAVSGVTELNFDYKDDGHCGAGAPRFNLELNGTKNAFLGCNSTLGTRSPVQNNAGWTHVEFSQSDIQSAVTTAGGQLTDNLTNIYIIADEGSGSGPDSAGTTNIDNISVNGQVVGSPTFARTKDDCKDNGWQNLLKANGSSYKNQGECVSTANHNEGRGNPAKYDNL